MFSSNGSDFSAMEPLNLTIAAAAAQQAKVTANDLPGASSAVDPAAAAALSAFWNQLILQQQQSHHQHRHGNHSTFLPGANIFQQLQQQQQQQQQLIAFLTLKNHLEQIKSQMTVIREHHHQPPLPPTFEQTVSNHQSSPSNGYDNDDANSSPGTKLEPGTPFDAEEVSVPTAVGLIKVASGSKSSSSRKRSRKISSGALTPNYSADEGTPPSKSVCIGGYYDANNVYAKLVTVSDEARRKLSSMPNIIGDYICALCAVKFEDAFSLAAHNCPKLEKTEHRCPECNKIFSCPANLASHRRWHRPKGEQTSGTSPSGTSDQGVEKKSTPTASKNGVKRPSLPVNKSKSKQPRLQLPISRKSVEPPAATEANNNSGSDGESSSTLIGCPMCSAELNRNELRNHLASHIAAQLANFQQQKQSEQPASSSSSSFVSNLLTAAAAVN